MSCGLVTVDQYGRPLCCETEIGSSSSSGGQWPLMLNPDDGTRKWLAGVTVDGNETFFFVDEEPKAQDDDDGLWRKVRFRTIAGQPVMYLDPEATSEPSYECVIKNLTSGALLKVRSRTVNGQPTPYLVAV